MGFNVVWSELEEIDHTVLLCVGLSSSFLQAVVCLALFLFVGRLVGVLCVD